MVDETCARCGQKTAASLGVHLSEENSTVFGGLGFHCGRCVAEVMSERRGEELRYLEVAPIAMINAAGRRCVFHFQYATTGPVPILSAFELEEGIESGYRVAVCAQPGESNASLVGRLLAKIRRELARTCVEDAPRLTLGLAMTGSEIRGWLSCDPERGEPCVFVDGRKLDWWTLGQLLLSHEGFHFKLAFLGLTEEAE